MYMYIHKYCNISTGVLADFHMIHYTQIIWEEVAFIWKVTGKAVAIIYDWYCTSVLNIAMGISCIGIDCTM